MINSTVSNTYTNSYESDNILPTSIIIIIILTLFGYGITFYILSKLYQLQQEVNTHKLETNHKVRIVIENNNNQNENKLHLQRLYNKLQKETIITPTEKINGTNNLLLG